MSIDRRTAPGLRKYPDELRARAYQLYTGQANSNLTEVGRLLNRESVDQVPVSTIQGWRDSERWDDRRAAETLALTELDTVKHVRLLAVAGHEATAYLRAVANGSEPEVNPDRLKAAIHLETAARSLILKHADTSTRKRASGKPPTVPSVDVSTLSSEALEQYEQELRRNGQGQ